MSASKLMTIRDLIDEAFGQPDLNVVHHKLVQTILIILARQLRLLERRVAVELGPLYDVASDTSLIIREVKLHTTVPKKKKQKLGGPKGTRTPKPSISPADKLARERSESSIGKKLSVTKSITPLSPETLKLSKKEKVKTSSEELAERLPQDVKELLAAAETKREKELRIIRQRADSREVREHTPTPIASLDSMEKQYEKLLIVERAPSDAAKGGAQGRSQQLSVVTLEEFTELAQAVEKLQHRLLPPGTAGFPENAQLMEDIRKGASLTDAMAALQLAARLEAAEKALAKMLSLVTDLAKKVPAVNEQSDKGTETGRDHKKTEVIYDTQPASRKPPGVSKTTEQSAELLPTLIPQTKSQISSSQSVRDVFAEDEGSKQKPEWITGEELDEALQELSDELMKVVNAATTRSNTNAKNALTLVNKLEGKLDESLNLGERMYDLENAVAEYAVQITTLDTGLSSQMTSFQEQLTQMQHDLEVGIETMQETLANTGGDTAAVAELNNQFTSLQLDFDAAALRQKELKDLQALLTLDLQSLWKQIEILRDTKSDRDEVTDALRDKAGLAALNGLVSRQEFYAVRGDFEKRIGSAYDKFNNQEIIWQRAIDDLLRDLNEKADLIQVVSLQDSIQQYIEKLKHQINTMLAIVGEPRAAAVSKKIHRDAACLSCASPAHMALEESVLPKLPAFPSSRPSAMSAEAKKMPREDGDHGICFPGLPAPHPVEPRSHICNRYCGGSHTMLNNTISRAPVSMVITPVMREVGTLMGADGKTYRVDEARPKIPCAPCNAQNATPEPYEADQAPVEAPQSATQSAHQSAEMTPEDFRQYSIQRMSAQNDDVTPPLQIDDDF